MYIEHLNLVVKDIKNSLSFYQAVFPHWKIRSKGTSDWYGKERQWIHFGDDYNYLALCDNGVQANRDLTGHQVGLAHFAYVTTNLEALIQRLENAGFSIAKPGAGNLHRHNVYYMDPDGYEVEFVEYLTDIPEQRNNND
jgi:catechol 2,3-dioxygenase-like lactoylglutathione lyase family enzyme